MLKKPKQNPMEDGTPGKAVGKEDRFQRHGAFPSAGLDGSVCLWDERKGEM